MTAIAFFVSIAVMTAHLAGESSSQLALQKAPMSLRIFVVNLGEGDGPVRISVDTEESWFVDDAEPFRSYSVESTVDGAVLEIDDLPPGDYALRVFHDEDGDGELKRGAFGIPDEPYGFSGLKTDRLKPKSFEDAKFVFDTTMKLTIKLR